VFINSTAVAPTRQYLVADPRLADDAAGATADNVPSDGFALTTHRGLLKTTIYSPGNLHPLELPESSVATLVFPAYHTPSSTEQCPKEPGSVITGISRTDYTVQFKWPSLRDHFSLYVFLRHYKFIAVSSIRRSK